MKLFKKSFAERRKILEGIPDGPYCYKVTELYSHFAWKTRPCPYWKKFGKDRAKCTLLGVSDRYPQALTLLWDQCKLCGYKEDYTTNET